MTETTALAIYNSGREYAAHPDSIGRPLAVMDVKVCDPDRRRSAPGRGRRAVLARPDRDHGLLEPAGGHRRDDRGRLAAHRRPGQDRRGGVRLHRRPGQGHGDQGGENVYCAEVEAALFEHPAIDDAAVIGIPDDELGEQVGAVVRITSPVTAGDLQAFLRTRLAEFKIPVRFWFHEEELPRNPGGKILKTVLRRDVLGR